MQSVVGDTACTTWTLQPQERREVRQLMFGFDKPEDGSEERYHDRWSLWTGAKLGGLQHYGWWLAHNLVAHPLIGLIPLKPLFAFHDWTSRRMHNDRQKRSV